MTEERTLPNFEKYQYGALAARLASSKENVRYAPSALEMLAGSSGLNLGEDAVGFIRGTQASEEGIKTAIQTYATKFEEKRGQYKPIELANSWYAPILSNLDEEDRNKIVAKLATYNESLTSITKKIQRASYIIEAPKGSGLFTDEQISDAKKTMERYVPALKIIETLDRYSFENLRPNVVKATRKQELKDLASQL